MAANLTAHADSITDAELADALRQLRDQPGHWKGPLGRQVLTEARRRYARLAVSCGLEREDGATFAWTYWTQELTDAQLRTKRDVLWSFSGGAIRKRMENEAVAQSKLTSVGNLRHIDVVGMDAPERFNSAEDIVGLDMSPYAEANEAIHGSERSLRQRQAIIAMRQVLVLAGMTEAQRELIVDELSRHVTTAVSLRAAAEAMRASPTPAVPIGQERWKALVALALGTAKGTPGLLHLVGSGHPCPMSEPHIKKLMNVILSRPRQIAAGVA